MSDIAGATITGTHKDDDDVVWFDIEVTSISGLRCKLVRVSRRYSEFDSLRSQLEEDGITVTDFPRKHLFNTDAVIAERKVELSDFIKCCVLPNLSNPACRAFLELDQGGADAEGVQIERQGEQLLELFCTSPELTVQISECATVLMLLQLVAKQMGLPDFAAELLQMEFSEAILTHETKLKDAGLRNQAVFSVMGGDRRERRLRKRCERPGWPGGSTLSMTTSLK